MKKKGFKLFILNSSFFIFHSGFLLAHPGVGIVMDSRGSVYYTDLAHVWKIAPDGTRTIAVRNVHTHELFIDPADNLFGEHLWYEGEAINKWGHRVWRLSSDGKLVDVIPAREGFLTNYSFVRDARGNMYWVDRTPPVTIKRRSPDGKISTIRPSASLNNVRWLTVTPDGTIYLVDFHDIVRIESSGRATTLARRIASRRISQLQVQDHHSLMGIWTDPARNVYVACYSCGTVKKIDRNRQISVVAKSPVMWSPTGGFFAPNDDLWLLEYSVTNQARVRKIGRDGRWRVYGGRS